MVSASAEFKRDLICESEKAGLDRARAEATPVGRPGFGKNTIERIRRLRQEGMSVRTIARNAQLSVGVVSNTRSRLANAGVRLSLVSLPAWPPAWP